MLETVARINGGLMAEYPRKKKHPERQFTETDKMQNYFSTLEDEVNDNKAMNIVHNMYLLSPGYAGSPQLPIMQTRFLKALKALPAPLL